MNEFTEKELIDILKSISGTLIDIKTELSELTVAVREAGEYEEESEEDSDEESEEDSE